MKRGKEHGLSRYQHADKDRQETAPTRTGKAPDRTGPGSGGAAATLLDLQSRAGNAAVGSLIAGEGPTVLRLAIQREEETAEATATKGAGDEGARPPAAMLASAGLNAPVPLLSFAMGGSRSIAEGGKAGQSRESRPAPNDVVVTIRLEDLDPALQTAAMEGTVFETMTISVTGASYILDRVVVSSLSVGGQAANLTFSCTSVRLA